MASASMSTASQPVIFFTQTSYPIPSQKFMIPTTWKRYQLSQLINKALALPNPIPFDFLVRKEILRTSLGQWCSENSVGEEETLEIEYIQSVMPPTKLSDVPHEDWVSSVLCQMTGYFVTASYDGCIRSFDYSKNLVSSMPAHAAPITSICIVPNSDPSSSSQIVASASHDLTGQLNEIPFPTGTPRSSPAKGKALATLHLHTSPVASIASNSAGSHLLTASWDTLIGLWTSDIPTTDEAPSDLSIEPDRKKRRRTDESGKARRKAPLLVLKSHTARVSKALFGPESSHRAYSCGFDSTVRLWDVESGLCIRTITSSEKPFFDLAVAPDEETIFATSSDRTLTVYDLREQTPTKSSSACFIHPATPSCVALGSPGSHQLVTGAYDGVVRLWDTRSTSAAMATFKAWEGTKKVLSVDWKNGIVAVGGEGGLELWKVDEQRA